MRWLYRKISWSRFFRIVPEVLVRVGLRPRYKPPSFVESLSRNVLLRKIALAQGLDFPVWQLGEKLAGRNFAQEIGLRVPELYQVGSVEECVAEVMRRGSGVIKPLQRPSAQGVVVLTRGGDGFYDHIRKRPVAVAALEGYVRRYQVAQNEILMAEELIFRPGSREIPSYDWKFYCFAGETGLIFQSDSARQSRRGPRPYLRRLGDFSPVRTKGRWGYREDRSLSDPFDPWTLREAAQRYSIGCKSVFARIDFYEDERGPVFGEITPHPAAGFWHNNDFGRELDEELGRMWNEAEIRVAADTLVRVRHDRP